jgi:hypothetical protein
MSAKQKAELELDNYFSENHHRFTQSEKAPPVSKYFKTIVFSDHPNS